MAEHGLVAPKGPQHLPRLRDILNGAADALPVTVVALCELLLEQIDNLSRQIDGLTAKVRKIAAEDDVTRRLMTIPGVGPISAVALATLAPPGESFAKGRDFAAPDRVRGRLWVGLTPRQHSTGGKTRLGRTSKMGQRDLRRLLIIGAMSVIRVAVRRGGAPEGSWLARMLARKPRMLVAVALANKMARTAWALIAHGGIYRDPAYG